MIAKRNRKGSISQAAGVTMGAVKATRTRELSDAELLRDAERQARRWQASQKKAGRK